MMKRRQFLGLLGVGGLASLAPGIALGRPKPDLKRADDIEVLELSEEQWRERLSEERFRILRKADTEPAGSSPLDKETRKGEFRCAGCDLPLFTSDMKYDSGTGWPSFYEHVEGHLLTSVDYKILWPRTEYHCARCGGHQGHVFEDGPDPEEFLQLPDEIMRSLETLNGIHHTGLIIFEALSTHLKIHSYYRLLDPSREPEFQASLQAMLAAVPLIRGLGVSGYMKMPYKDTRTFSHIERLPERFYPRDPRAEVANRTVSP